MGYFGLTPGEYSTGGKHKRSGITKCGNSHARWIMVECATHYGKEPRVGANLSRRQEGLPRWIKETSWAAQNRLYLRYWEPISQRCTWRRAAAKATGG